MAAQRKIAVTGATGRVGRHLVEVLEERGHDVVAISRSAGVDLFTGDGLAEALAGVESVIDAVAGASPEQQAATDFFTTTARNLQQVGAEAGLQRERDAPAAFGELAATEHSGSPSTFFRGK